jgi:hypothetical protein
MGKDNKKKPSVQAPVVEKPEEKKLPAEKTTVNTGAPGVPDGMSQHDKVLYGSLLQHRKDEMIRNGGESAEKYQALTMIEDAILIDVAVTELVIKKNPMSLILTANEKNYGAIKLLANEMGVNIPEFKSLPKPTKEQLAAAGLTDAAGKVVLKLEDKDVSKETKEQKKKEQRSIDESVKKDYMKDHTKIETDEQLKEALGFQLVNPAITNPIEKLITTAQFYRAYLEAHAEKADDPQAELAKIHELTLADLLQDITTMVKPTFVAQGFGNLLGRRAHDANSVIPAFCMFKNCVIDRKTGKAKYSDEEIAAFVRVLIVWYVSSKSAEMSEAIKAKEENIKVLKKDAKANAKGIETEEKKISGLKKSIEHFNGMLSLVTDPSFEIVDNLIADYKNKENANHIYAVEIVKAILDTYYRDADIPELEFDSALLNVQQRAGIILNLFTSEIVKRDEYSEANLIPQNEPSEEEKNEEESKN